MIRNLMIATAVWALSTPAFAGWQVAETEHFRVYSKGAEAGLTRQAVLLEDYHRLLTMATNRAPGSDAAPKLDIFIVDSVADSRPYLRTSDDIGGYYSAEAGRMGAFAEVGDFGNTTLLHEYAHHFMMGSGAIAYPQWYLEGFAEYFMTAVFKPDVIEFGATNRNRAEWLLYARWVPMSDLIAARPRLKSDNAGAMFYAQSWLLTHYLFRTPGMPAKLDAYLRAVASGEDSLKAFKAHIDPDPAAVQSRLRDYLHSRVPTFSRFQRPAAMATPVTVTRLSASADRMLMLLTATEFGLEGQQRTKVLAEIRKVAAALPDDALAQRTLALVEVQNGDRAAGMAIIDRLLTATPDDAALLRWRAAALAPYATPEKMIEARRMLARSFKIDPADWRTLYQYALLFDPINKPLDATTLDVLLQAHGLAPQVTEITMATAAALVRADRLAEALRPLESVAYSVHGGKAKERAAAMLVLARAGDKAGLLAVLAKPQEDEEVEAR